MFDTLTERLSSAANALRGRGRLTEDNIADTLRQVRMALLEADVAVPVVKAFTDSVKVRALGEEVSVPKRPVPLIEPEQPMPAAKVVPLTTVRNVAR